MSSMQIEFEWVSSQLGRGLGMPDHRCQATSHLCAAWSQPDLRSDMLHYDHDGETGTA